MCLQGWKMRSLDRQVAGRKVQEGLPVGKASRRQPDNKVVGRKVVDKVQVMSKVRRAADNGQVVSKALDLVVDRVSVVLADKVLSSRVVVKGLANQAAGQVMGSKALGSRADKVMGSKVLDKALAAMVVRDLDKREAGKVLALVEGKETTLRRWRAASK